MHRCEVEIDGTRRDVAVKVLRPAIERIFHRDIEAQLFVARLIERFIPSRAALNRSR